MAVNLNESEFPTPQAMEAQAQSGQIGYWEIYQRQLWQRTIVDADGLGSIRIGQSAPLSGGKRIAAGLWESEDKGLVYLLQGGDLIIGQRTAPATPDKPIDPESIANNDHSTGSNDKFDAKNHATNDVGWRLAA